MIPFAAPEHGADYAETCPEIDTQRLALIGYSLGGYLAPRAAAMEPRIRACIASPLAVDIEAAFNDDIRAGQRRSMG